ncbi:MAG: Sir2 family NAD-dependent protein deacetylase [Methylobacteriaceae bacterium]|jgi:NAD-dependent deacetylase|nr:Sir2 family NAD-dependent protein deacetylase [Methylobacteriaceae bacterium]
MARSNLRDLVPQLKGAFASLKTPGEYGRFLVYLLSRCDNAVGFTGAGISTESGIPDYRSAGALWAKYMPVQYQDFVSNEQVRVDSWRRKFELDEQYGDLKPNTGHLAFANAVKKGRMSAVITQNIDGLHQKAGVPDDRVIELHGNGTYATCLSCGKRYELADIRADLEKTGKSPRCSACGGIVKDAIVSFGQQMPEEAMRRAHDETAACDLFIVGGSSLVVYPAAGFPSMARRRGAVLVIINRDPTDQDADADFVIHGELGPVLAPLVNCEFDVTEFNTG